MIESSCTSCGAIFKGRFDRDEHQCPRIGLAIARGIPTWVVWLVVIIFLVVAAAIR